MINISVKNASLVGSCLCSLAAGVVYVFSLYGPQLASKFDYNSTQVNIISIGGNMGVYLSSPLFGYWADRYGPRRIGLISPFLFLTGFLCISLTYNQVFSYTHYFFLCIYYFIVGLGCGSTYMCGIAVAGHNFKTSRGFGIGIPIAFFGISAFMFSSIHTLFFVQEDEANTGGFLTFLAISNFIITLIGGSLLVKTDYTQVRDISESNLISNEHREEADACEVDIHGWELFYSLDARLLFFCIFCVAGSGLMYINNIGNILKALNVLDPVPSVPHLQGLNVSTISLLNCMGRLFVAMTSDHLLNKWQIRRINFFIFSSILMAMCQFLNSSTSTTLNMTMNSAVTGFAYGTMFAVAPTMVSDWFGSRRFGSNWGWMNLAPACGAQITSFLFGTIYDSHVSVSANHSLCKEGVICYSTSFVVTGILCILSTITLFTLKKRRFGYYY